MLRTAVRIGVVLLIAHALYRTVPVYWSYYQFKDAVEETALYSKNRTDAEITQRVIELAAQFDVPIDRETLEVRRDADYTYIDLWWVQRVEIVPRYHYPWRFEVSTRAWHIKPVTAGDVR